MAPRDRPSSFDDSAPAPKMAVKGFSISSSSSKKHASKAPPPSSLGKRGRDTFGAQDDSGDDDEHVNGRERSRYEEVSGFAEGGAVSKGDDKRKKQDDVLIISKIANKDWRLGKRQKSSKNLLPEEVQRQQAAESASAGAKSQQEGVDVVDGAEDKIQYGLSFTQKKKAMAFDEGDGSVSVVKKHKDKTNRKEDEMEVEPKTDDQLAMDELLGISSKPKEEFIIRQRVVEDHLTMNEADTYRAAIAAAPDVSTLEDYERVPVEEFGAALLRGMGWKGEVVKGAKEAKRRQNLLGLGAKQLKDAEELGAWVQKSDVKRLNNGGSKSGMKRERQGDKMEEYRKERDRRRERRDRDDRDAMNDGRSDRRERDRDRDYDYRTEDGYRQRDRRRDGDRDRDRRR